MLLYNVLLVIRVNNYVFLQVEKLNEKYKIVHFNSQVLKPKRSSIIILLLLFIRSKGDPTFNI